MEQHHLPPKEKKYISDIFHEIILWETDKKLKRKCSYLTCNPESFIKSLYHAIKEKNCVQTVSHFSIEKTGVIWNNPRLTLLWYRKGIFNQRLELEASRSTSRKPQYIVCLLAIMLYVWKIMCPGPGAVA